MLTSRQLATIEQLIVPYGYPLERHQTVTSDGYVLTLYRIPHGSSKSPRRNYTRKMQSSPTLRQGQPAIQQQTRTTDIGFKNGAKVSNASSFLGRSADFDLVGGDSFPSTVHQDGLQNGQTTSAPRGPVLLQHGLFDSSPTWVANGIERSLAFTLANQGFDVWLGNARGTKYSQGHMHCPVDSPEFWDFSFDEMAQHDIPAMVQHILTQTGWSTMAYVGHSQGSQLLVAALASTPSLNAKIRCACLLAPAVFVTNLKCSWAKALAESQVAEQLCRLGLKDFPPGNYSEEIGQVFYGSRFIKAAYLEDLCGSYNNFDTSQLREWIRYSITATSTRNLVHWTQRVTAEKNNTFSMFDFGDTCSTWNGEPQDCNWRRYGTTVPPKYNLSNVQTSLLVYSGARDTLATPKDVSILLRELPRDTVAYAKELGHYGHVDFIQGLSASSDLYPELVEFLADEKACVAAQAPTRIAEESAVVAV